MNGVFVRSALNYDMQAASLATGLYIPDNEDERLTKQEFVEEADINTLVRRFGLAGELPPPAPMEAFVDYDGVHDYQSALNLVREAAERFMEYPAEVREVFRNDPGRMEAFLQDEGNREKAEAMGLVIPRESSPVPSATPTEAPKAGAGLELAPKDEAKGGGGTT